MGIITSKLFKSESKSPDVSERKNTESPKKTMEIPDVRSPTADITRTPIVVEKSKPELDYQRECRSVPLRTKLLKSLKLDPRSPTVGIYRTPILVEDIPSSKPSTDNTDSPVSIYSCNISDSVIQDVMTPNEPSVNVSGFETEKEIYDELVTLEGAEIKDEEPQRSSLKIIDRPNTYEAKKLLEEIISDEENFLKKVKIPSKKNKKTGQRHAERNVISDLRGKSRTPLSNITSSTNSPNHINASIKFLSKNKVVPELGSENSASPQLKHLVQWDQNNTVVI